MREIRRLQVWLGAYQVVADTGPDSSGSASSLPGVGHRDPLGLQRRHVGLDVEVGHLDLAAVDDVDDVLDGNRRFWNG